MRWLAMADPSRHDQRLLERAVGVLAQYRHLWTVHFLARLAGIAVAAAHDRIQHDLIADTHAVDVRANGIHDASAVRAENRGQRPLRQPASDEHVEVIQRHVLQADPHFAWTWLGDLALS